MADAVDRLRAAVRVVTVAQDVRAERAALADTLELVGPHASAGCGDWTGFDLAAHVIAADRAAGTLAFCIRMLAARGIRFNPNPKVIAAAINRERRDGYPALLARLRRRPPRLLLTPAVAASTLFEVWAHHDDLTTTHGLVHHTPDHLAHAIPPLVRYHARRLPTTGLIIRTSDGHQWTLGPDVGGPSAVVLSGRPTDLIRWLSGRGPLTTLGVEAKPAAAEQLQAFVGTI
ncbi:MAG: maleylpyruvate isomerase family mycothiol-dependent enzyme [Actinobacteria bacterium]|nr:maleylpyruvate isomerase family mycothiol-dependent enzyme [Actinomycetota bacterium]